ncbi:unnamed protein product [Camellia sinensis]
MVHESKFIQEIVKQNRTVLNVAPHPIGLDARVKNINLWLQDGSTEVGVLAIYGMGGIGKTTIAKTAYNLNFDKFDSSSFLANCGYLYQAQYAWRRGNNDLTFMSSDAYTKRYFLPAMKRCSPPAVKPQTAEGEASEQPNGLVGLQRQLLSDILKTKAKKVYNVDEGILRIKNAVCCKRVLVVLDDVDHLDQLNVVFGMREWFFRGSKIIITTRHERLLKARDVCEMYKVKELDDKESLQLFSWHAFGQDHPAEGYMELSERVLQHCGGIPLALQVLGCSMSGRSVDVWESAIKKLEAIPDSQILKKLKVSYDSLEDVHDKNLFLDIVCFFIGKDKDYTVRILDAIVGIQNLINRCLLMLGEDNKMKMHDLIRDMGRDIIRQESPEEPGERGRLWHHKDSLYVLSEKTGTEKIEGLVLDMQMFMEDKPVETFFSNKDAKRRRSQEVLDEILLIKQDRSSKRRQLDILKHSIDAISKISNEADLKTDAFAKMHEVRLLQFHYIKLTGCYKELPNKLKWVYWRGFPLKYIPDDFALESLVALEMRNSSLKQVWRGTKVLRLLRFLNLCHSHSLAKTPDFSGLPNLERLILKDCTRLVEVHESIGELERLVFLNLRDCQNLRNLPNNICKLKSLEKLILSGCSKLVLPVELGKLESLTEFHADKIAVNQLVSTNGELKSLRSFFWSWLSKRRKHPEFNFSLDSLSQTLVKLSLAKCNLSNAAIPIDLSSLSLLQYLNLSENPICSLPDSIKGLCMLEDLWLDSCTSLQSLPELPSSLVKLKAQNCTSLKRITNLPNLLNRLFLDVSDCNRLVEVQGLFRLEPIGNFVPEMINSLGLFNLESIKNTEVELFNNMTKTRIKCPIQGLYEFGIFSTSLPGNEIPGWFSHKAKGHTISFSVPSQPNLKMRGFNACFVYSRSRGIPDAKEDMTWLSHWKFENQLEVGDEVSVSVVGWSLAFCIKDCGISFMYEEQEEQKRILTKSEIEEEHVINQNTAHPLQNVTDSVESAYQMRSGEYFLSHSEYFMLAEGSSQPAKAILYENLFQDNVESTGLTYEGEEGEGEEEGDSDDFYDDDNYDEEELMTILGWQLCSMASERVQEASSSLFRCTYHVFLSFRGKDTRKTFIDHVYTALVNVGIHTFRDDDEIERGENIKLELKKAIEESRISIVVFSKGYASSSWCLDELVKILERKNTSRHVVLPVFYNVDPTQVRNQTGSFAKALALHEKQFQEETDDRKKQQHMEKVEGWRAALREVADLGGMVLQNQTKGHEAKFIQEIVKAIGDKLNRTMLNVSSHLVGIESQVKTISMWLQDGATDVGVAVLCGMGGIGKTAIAKVVYNLNFDRFERSSFLPNVRETSEQPNGVIRLQTLLLSDIINGKKRKIYKVDEGICEIRDAICCKRVLVVLDDVDRVDQLYAIIGKREWLCSGSKIVITTRYKPLLKSLEGYMKCKIKKLNIDESLHLFCWHAFGQDNPAEGYMELSRSIVYYCGGLPLALQVLGSSLCGKNIYTWESALEKLRAIPDSEIQNILKISYDSLQDDHDKNLFLDIACFFIGKDKDYTIEILHKCDFYPIIGIQNLIDKSLLTIDKDNKLMMHPLLRDMGREIVRQESPKEPGKRSRIWHDKFAFDVLREETGTETVEGLTLNLDMLDKDDSTRKTRYCCERFGMSNLLHHYSAFNRYGFGRFYQPKEVSLKTHAFARMQRLRLLQLDYVKLTGDWKEFPKKLRWLSWHGFPLKSMPNYLHLENLVFLDMRGSSLEQLWKGTKFLESLKILNLSHSYCLTTTPDFSGLPSLQRLMLKDCVSLVEIHESIGDLRELVFLNLRNCESLRELPREIGMLKSLQELILSDCSKLDNLPEELGRLKSLKVFHADRIAVRNLNASIQEGISWHGLFQFRKSSSLKPTSFSLALLPHSLVSLSLVDCNLSDDAIPNDLSCLPSLQSLDLSENPIHSLPESIKALTMLKSLQLDNCKKLQLLPELPASLMDLLAKHCTSLERITNLPNLLKSLHLEIFGCEKLVEILGLFTLKPIGSIDTEMTNGMGLLMESAENIVVQMANSMTRTTRKQTLQGLYECGIFSVFLPGSKVPGWFSHQSTGSSISFELLPLLNRKIQGMNLCVVYALCESRNYDYEPIKNNFKPQDDGFDSFHNMHYAIITNKTKGIKWTYSPTFYGIPEGNEDMLWLSHWNFGNQLEGGDEVNVSVFMAKSFLPKECGINLVYEEEEGTASNNVVVFQHTYLFDKNVKDVDKSKHQTVELLCHHRFIYHQVNPKQFWAKRYSRLCFCGSVNNMRRMCYSRPRLR